jgi:hypothetical protein
LQWKAFSKNNLVFLIFKKRPTDPETSGLLKIVEKQIILEKLGMESWIGFYQKKTKFSFRIFFALINLLSSLILKKMYI